MVSKYQYQQIEKTALQEQYLYTTFQEIVTNRSPLNHELTKVERLFNVVYWWQTVVMEMHSDTLRSLQDVSIY